MRNIEKIEKTLAAFKLFRSTLDSISKLQGKDEKIDDWISKEISSADFVIANLDKELSEAKRPKDTNEFLRIRLDGINAKMRVYHDALANCSEETEGRLLNALIDLKKSKEKIESTLKEHEPKIVEPEEQEIPERIKQINQVLVDNAMEKINLEDLSNKLGISLFYCVAELRGDMEDAVEKACKSVSNGVDEDGELATSESKHFLVKIVKKDDQLGILVFTNK